MGHHLVEFFWTLYANPRLSGMRGAMAHDPGGWEEEVPDSPRGAPDRLPSPKGRCFFNDRKWRPFSISVEWKPHPFSTSFHMKKNSRNTQWSIIYQPTSVHRVSVESSFNDHLSGFFRNGTTDFWLRIGTLYFSAVVPVEAIVIRKKKGESATRTVEFVSSSYALSISMWDPHSFIPVSLPLIPTIYLASTFVFPHRRHPRAPSNWRLDLGDFDGLDSRSRCILISREFINQNMVYIVLYSHITDWYIPTISEWLESLAYSMVYSMVYTRYM